MISGGAKSLVDLQTFLGTPASSRQAETGYVQVFFQQMGSGSGSMIQPRSGYQQVARSQGYTGNGGVDTHALFFVLASTTADPYATTASYRIFAADANTHSGNRADYLSGVDDANNPFTVNAGSIGKANVSGNIPEPAGAALLAVAATGLLPRRASRRRV